MKRKILCWLGHHKWIGFDNPLNQFKGRYSGFAIEQFDAVKGKNFPICVYCGKILSIGNANEYLR